MDSYVHLLKIVVIGDAGVGKSAMLLRLSTGRFEETMPPTIGLDFHVKTIRINDQTVKLTIWDTAGQERFRTLTSSYYRNCSGVVLVYDVSCKGSFEHLQGWMEEIDVHVNRQRLSILLVGNKIDLMDRQISFEEARAYACNQAMTYAETSAKTDEGIWPAFRSLVTRILDTSPNPLNKVQVSPLLESVERHGCC